MCFMTRLAIFVRIIFGPEIAFKNRNQLLGHFDLPRIGSFAGRRPNLARRKHLLGVPERNQQQIAVMGAKSADILLLAHDPAREPFASLSREASARAKYVLRVAIRPKIVRADRNTRCPMWPSGKKLASSIVGGRLRLKLLKFLIFNNDEGVRLNLVSFTDLIVSNFFARARIDHVLLHPRMGTFLEQVKMNRPILDRRVELNGKFRSTQMRKPFQIARAAIRLFPRRFDG